jgi:hypothetical protein
MVVHPCFFLVREIQAQGHRASGLEPITYQFSFLIVSHQRWPSGLKLRAIPFISSQPLKMETLMWGGEITRQQILQSICLFQTLNQVPEPPKDHLLSTENDPKYCLSALREKEVASNMAFLSSISDNPLRVMAVCIEEHDNKEGITIRMASNTGDLSLVVNGFNKMAQVLEQAARQGIFPHIFQWSVL